jgi:NAD-dependent dihydropyrimidine dehydrogenase PreA subunit
MNLRKVIRIDEEKCDGCGLCVPACIEGALQIIDGKARLVSETYCDGLGACLGECPQGAITIEERQADEFDAEAVARHLNKPELKKVTPRVEAQSYPSCPGSLSRTLQPKAHLAIKDRDINKEATPSQLGNWPVQLKLAPVKAPYFEKAKLLIAADCVPFAHADFHRRFLEGRVLLIGCPKLDENELYLQKLTMIFSQNDIELIEIIYMEVPCCFGLAHLVRRAVADSGKEIPLSFQKIGIKGEILESITQ